MEYHYLNTREEAVELLYEKIAQYAKVNVDAVHINFHKYFTDPVREKLRNHTVSIPLKRK